VRGLTVLADGHMAIQRDQIIDAAFRLLDESGMDGMTLRKLACALGVRAPSLYWHFPGKRALLDAMADALLAGVAHDIPAGQPWRQTLLRIGSELRGAFKAHRDGARVYAGSYCVSPNVLRTAEALTRAFVDGGASPAMAAGAGLHVMYYVLGFVIEEQALPAYADEAEQIRNDFLEITQARFPCLWEARDVLVDMDGASFDQRFVEGLDQMLDGMEQPQARGARRKAP
jgi:TetR/AcrR family tetracycline transcriptional repressor